MQFVCMTQTLNELQKDFLSGNKKVRFLTGRHEFKNTNLEVGFDLTDHGDSQKLLFARARREGVSFSSAGLMDAFFFQARYRWYWLTHVDTHQRTTAKK